MSRIFTKNPQTYTLEIQRNPYFYIVLSLSILCLILTLLYIFKENIKSISLYRVQKSLNSGLLFAYIAQVNLFFFLILIYLINFAKYYAPYIFKYILDIITIYNLHCFSYI